MLRRIEKLVVEDCRIWQGRHEFDFENGVNVIQGDNRVGKSTLALMLMLTMTHEAKSDPLKKDSFQKHQEARLSRASSSRLRMDASKIRKSLGGQHPISIGGCREKQRNSYRK